ncbi:MAG: GDP-L-fucose synthase [Bacteroidetes bacterium]|nr:GDP-L-fucose synthase [Bacteroidota bacterium]
MDAFFKDNKFLLTGGAGFLGSFIVDKLIEKGVKKQDIRIPRSKNHDLRTWENCKEVVKDIDIVIHLAARVGGIGFNMKYPANLFYDNAMMGIQLLEASRLAGVKKFIGMGTVCSYPKFTPVPFKEDDLWNGFPEETNSPYGIAKKILLVQQQAYRAQYGFDSIYLIPVNLYGPRDHFDPEDSHVIPALILKFSEAKRNNEGKVTVWGTGRVSREFLYVEDAAQAILDATERYNKPEPINIGTSEEIMIKDLVDLIKDLVGYKGNIVWDSEKPDGQPKRKLDVSKAEQQFGFKSTINLEQGLQKTITWFNNNYYNS